MRELTKSLDQQTATSNVLEVISRSAFDLQAVFEALAESSVRALCRRQVSHLPPRWRATQVRSGLQRFRGIKRVDKANPIRPSRHGGAARAALERRTVHIPDILADPEYTYGSKAIESFRTVLGVPILKGEEVLGVILVYHLGEVQPFTDKQIDWSRPSPTRPRSQSRTFGCWPNASAHRRSHRIFGTADGDFGDTGSHQQLPYRSQPAFDAIVRSGLRLFPTGSL